MASCKDAAVGPDVMEASMSISSTSPGLVIVFAKPIDRLTGAAG
jgi:hypothetical protein